MTAEGHMNGGRAPGRLPMRRVGLVAALLPVFLVVGLLFGGGLALAFLQAMGQFPAAERHTLSLVHFQHVFSDPDFMRSLGLTFYISSVSTLMATGLSILFAMILLTLSERYRWLHLILQVPLVVPHLVVAVAMMFLLSPTGLFARLAHALHLIDSSSRFPLLVNDPLAIGIISVYVWKEIPFITLMIFSVLRHNGPELLQVGRTLNAGRWQRFRYIVLPMIFPGLAAAALIVFAYTFGAFEVPYLLGQTWPMTLPVWAYRNYSDIDLMARPEGIAAGIVIAVVVTICVLAAYGLVRTARTRGGWL